MFAKKISILLIMIFSLTIAFSSKITLDNIQVSDYSINSGSSGELTFTIENTHSSAIIGCTATISSDLTLSQNTINFKRLDVGEVRTIVLTYSAPYSLQAKTYSILIAIDYDDGANDYSVQQAVLINLLKNNQLIVENYSSSLLIDSTTNFTATLVNHGNSELNNLFIELVLPDGFIPSSGTQYFIPFLGKEESTTISSNIFLEKSIEPQPYTIEIIKIADDYNDSDVLNILSRGVPNLVISGINIDPEIPQQGVMQTLSVQYENIGSGKAYNVESRLNLSQEVVGVTVEYLGTLDRDDLTSAIFDFIATKEIQGNIELTYSDEQGNEYSLIQEISYDSIASTNTSPFLIAILIVAGAGITFFVYKKIKNSKMKK